MAPYTHGADPSSRANSPTPPDHHERDIDRENQSTPNSPDASIVHLSQSIISPSIYSNATVTEPSPILASNSMVFNKDKPRLEIMLDSPFLVLKGTGPDVEPTTLSGQVVLHLTESTSIKEITLQFRGKARVPDSLIKNNFSLTYVILNHDWSFLEGSKKHARTLKAGRHFFPFNLAIGGTLPSSISTPVLGGASVAYKLRAVVARPAFSSNLQCILPVQIIRSFTSDSLEYQQTLGIENTWPGKIMYAILVPHKAWAAGDTFVAVLKFSPMGKGVSVVNVISAFTETTKVHTRTGILEDTRTLQSVKHVIVEGRAVEVDFEDDNAQRERPRLVQALGFTGIGANSPTSSRPNSRRASSYLGGGTVRVQELPGPSRQSTTNANGSQHDELGYKNHDVVTYIKIPIPPSAGNYFYYTASGSSPAGLSRPTTPAPPSNASGFTPATSPYPTTAAAASSMSNQTCLSTPSHALEPITVTHRIKWSIYIRNLDGHLSKLRCSLPVVILDGRVLEEARACSMVTRRMMYTSSGILDEGILAGDEEAWGFVSTSGPRSLTSSGSGSPSDDNGVILSTIDSTADRELPSYNAHVRDRVANMFLPETLTMRVSNPWIGKVGVASKNGGEGSRSGAASPISATGPTSADALISSVANGEASVNQDLTQKYLASTTGSSSAPQSRASRFRRSTPGGANIALASGAGNGTAEAHAIVMLHLPHAPDSGQSSPLDWVNSELLLSLSDESIRRYWGGVGGVPPASGNTNPSSSSAVGALGFNTPPVPRYVASGPAGTSTRAGRRWSRAGSSAGSHAGSRAPSPMTDHLATANARPSGEILSRPASPIHGYEPLSSSSFTSPNAIPPSFSSGAASSMRNLQHLFKATMKPFTALVGGKDPGERDKDAHTTIGRTASTLAPGAMVHSKPPLNSLTGPELLHRALTDVPDYSIASRGFIGGVPPLSSMRGLPSYGEAVWGAGGIRENRDFLEVAENAKNGYAEGSGVPRSPGTSNSRSRRGTLTRSESDLTISLTGRLRHGVASANADSQSHERAQPADDDAEEDDADDVDEGIQMRSQQRQ